MTKARAASVGYKPDLFEGWPLTGIENARPATKAAGRPRMDPSKLPFDPREFIKKVPGWDGAEFDREE